MTTTTRHPAVVQALNFAIIQTGCSKQKAAMAVIRALTEEGVPFRPAYEAVWGPGSYRELTDAVHDAMQPA
jgi:hypothetical protein